MKPLTRRDFIGTAGSVVALAATGCATTGPRCDDVIDCHTHFYDPTRAEGVPWPGRQETQLYRRVLPDDYKRVAQPHGITGTVVVEASAWLEDNQWILDLARREPFIRGFVGNLSSGDPNFASHVKRFAKNPLFRGIRVSGANVSRLTEIERLRHLHLLADHDLSLDVNGGVATLPDVAAISRSVPALRIIIDHVANVRIDGQTPPDSWLHGMAAVGNQPNVFCKVSGLVEGSGRRSAAPRDDDFYRPVLDHVWNCFGEDRVLYGSNWPVSDLFAEFATVHGIVRDYFAGKGGTVQRKFFCHNSRIAYQWQR